MEVNQRFEEGTVVQNDNVLSIAYQWTHIKSYESPRQIGCHAKPII